MIFPDVVEWLALALSVTPETPMADLRAASARMGRIFQAMDKTRQDLVLGELDRMGRKPRKRDIA